MVLDGLLAALALAAVAWVFVVQRALLGIDMPLPVTLVMIAYPSMSIFMVVVTLRIVLDPYRDRVPAVWLLMAGMALMFAGDVAYLFADLGLAASPHGSSTCPMPWPTCAPAPARSTRRCAGSPSRGGRAAVRSRFRIALVAVALLIPAVLTVEDRSSALTERLVLCALMIAMTATAVARLVRALRTAEQSETRLIHQAHHDSLTGLPNRRMMEEHLSGLLERAPVDNSHVALLYLDLDRFKLINDTLGHGHGDDLLVEVADRLRRNVRPSDLVTRIGGDEFMIVLGHVVNVSEAVDLANRLRPCLTAPSSCAACPSTYRPASALPSPRVRIPDGYGRGLIRDADTAMYQAKDAGRDAVAVFDESMRTAIAERVELERDLRHAIARNQLHVVYQPIVHLPGGTWWAWRRSRAGRTRRTGSSRPPSSSPWLKTAG